MTKILLVCANPRGSNPLRTAEEDRTLRESIQLSENRDRIEIETLNAATVDDLRRALLRKPFDVVHFSGHGTEKGLVFEDARGRLMVPPSRALAELLARRRVKVALLNACYSLSAGTITAVGVEYTVASSGPISDRGAIEFARGFYDALGAGTSVPEAYEEGLSAAQLKGFTIDAVLLRQGDEYVPAAPQGESPGELREVVSPSRTLLCVALDVSGSMQSSIRNRAAGDQSRFDSVLTALTEVGAQVRDELLRNRDALPDAFQVFLMGFGLRVGTGVADLASLWRAADRIDIQAEVETRKRRHSAQAARQASAYGDLAALARNIGFGGVVDSVTEAATRSVRDQIVGEIASLVLAETARIGDSTLTAQQLASLFEGSPGNSDMRVLEQVIFGLTPMVEAAVQARHRFERMNDDYEQRTLLVVSDGDPTDGDPSDQFAAIRESGVDVISSFVTSADIADPRVLVGAPVADWPAGARLMWEIASPLNETSAAARYLLDHGWLIEPRARMFVQVNHSDVMKEFVQVAAGFLASETTMLLPRGQ